VVSHISRKTSEIWGPPLSAGMWKVRKDEFANPYLGFVASPAFFLCIWKVQKDEFASYP
jgi:hypothetical protein